jgi:hypothetical protein
MTPDPNVAWVITLLVCWGVFYSIRNVPSLRCAPFRLLFYIILAIFAPLTILPHYVDLRTHSGHCRSEPSRPAGRETAVRWQDMCHWIKKNTPKTARFWIPRDGVTFKWHAQRSDTGILKDIPQDAESIVKWRKAMDDLFYYTDAEGVAVMDGRITGLLLSKTEKEIAALQQKYGFEYVICVRTFKMPEHSTLQLVYENDVYCLYRVLPR